MTDPVFSVIVPTYNRPSALLACLGGLSRQRYPSKAFEVIVVNDGEALPTLATLGSVTGGVALQVIQNSHAGPAVARNAGAAAASGTFLAFIDDDCIPDAGWLQALAARLLAEPAALVGGPTVNALESYPYSDASQLLVDFVASYYDASAPSRTRFFATSNLAVPAARFRGFGGFDGHFHYAAAEDRDFCDRWHGSGGRSVFEPEAIVYHHHVLGMAGFLAQHFRYGRGAFLFHRAKAARDARPLRTPVRFYLDLVLYPLARRRLLAGAARAALLTVAQVATAAGYWWEDARERRREAKAPGHPPAA